MSRLRTARAQALVAGEAGGGGEHLGGRALTPAARREPGPRRWRRRPRRRRPAPPRRREGRSSRSGRRRQGRWRRSRRRRARRRHPARPGCRAGRGGRGVGCDMRPDHMTAASLTVNRIGRKTTRNKFQTNASTGGAVYAEERQQAIADLVARRGRLSVQGPGRGVRGDHRDRTPRPLHAGAGRHPAPRARRSGARPAAIAPRGQGRRPRPRPRRREGPDRQDGRRPAPRRAAAAWSSTPAPPRPGWPCCSPASCS